MIKLKPDIKLIVDFLNAHPGASSKEIYDGTSIDLVSYVTLQRLLKSFVEKSYLTAKGLGKGTKYYVNIAYQVIHEVNIEEYFKKEIDERIINRTYNQDLIRNVLNKIEIFSQDEIEKLNDLQKLYETKMMRLNEVEYKMELERLAIDLSWKSSQIEGNTYSLLETERLLKNKETAAGKTKDEAVMLLNHKKAIDFLVEHQDYVKPLTLKAIEDIHSILIGELDIERNLRKRSVGITGTNYRPLENEFQIKEALEEMCGLINLRENVFEKALLAILIISYIQPFNDGNKRTARIVSNSLLMVNHYCPISFRTIDSTEFKMAMLIFYEQNNISAFKKIFIDQFEFAVNTYF